MGGSQEKRYGGPTCKAPRTGWHPVSAQYVFTLLFPPKSGPWPWNLVLREEELGCPQGRRVPWVR